MSLSPQVHLFIPQLFSPLARWQQDFAFQPKADSVLVLLAHAKRCRLPVTGLERTLLHVLGYQVDKQLPWAQLRYAQAISQAAQVPSAQAAQATEQAAAKVLLCADPVCLHSHSDRVNLHPEPLLLSAADSSALLHTLNTHLAEDGWQLIAPSSSPSHWYLRALEGSHPQAALPQTRPPSEIGMDNIFSYLPQANAVDQRNGSAGRYWPRLMSELQMLLHNHPVNQQRERAGQLPVNAVWLWGEGELSRADPAGVSAPPVLVCGGGQLGQLIAWQSGCRWSEDFQELADGDVLLILDQLLIPALQDDMTAWQAALQALEAGYLQPLLKPWRTGQYRISLYSGDGDYWHCQPTPRWQFWRSSRTNWGA